VTAKRSFVCCILMLQIAAVHAAATGAATATAAGTAAPLPGNSILQVRGHFTSQSGHSFQLAARRGTPQLIGMFYASCQSVCPLLIETARSVTGKLEPAQRARLQVLLVTLDPERDDVAALAGIAAEHRLDAAQWTLARTDGKTVRQLAAVLDIRYRKLESGDFNHTSALILLDADGRVQARTESLGAATDPEFMAAVRRVLSVR
jgi:protein SCO1